MIEVIRVKILEGTTLEKSYNECFWLAVNYDCVVEFSFNKKEYRIDKYTLFSDLKN